MMFLPFFHFLRTQKDFSSLLSFVFVFFSAFWLAERGWAAPQGEELAASVSKIRFPVERYQLKNGLTVILQPDNSNPLIAYYTFFRVGSRNEKPGETGLAHLFEHLSYLGTQRFPNHRYEQILQDSGAYHNAATSHDTTTYFVVAPSSLLETVMDLESDRLMNLQFDEEKLKSEREVVKEERRMRIENSPVGVLFENVFATVFKVHPYRWPISGYMKDLDALTLEHARQFYKAYYSPKNAVLVIAGDINSKSTKKLIDKYYSQLISPPDVAREIVQEPEQKQTRELIVKRNVQSAFLSMAYPIPNIRDKESNVLAVLGLILGGGSSSRLHRCLVHKRQIASAVAASAFSLEDPGVFMIQVALKPNTATSTAQNLIMAELDDLRRKPVSETELLRAKNAIMTDFVNSLKKAEGRAQNLGFNEVNMGSYKYLFDDLEAYNAVTAEQVQQAVNKYLLTSKSNVVRLVPLTSEAKQ